MTTINTPCIINCTPAKFKAILLKYMQRFEDYQQVAADQAKPEETIQYFVDAYNELDITYNICFRKATVAALSPAVRNQARLIIKYAEQLACTELQTHNA